jgi:hypothetical protein
MRGGAPTQIARHSFQAPYYIARIYLRVCEQPHTRHRQAACLQSCRRLTAAAVTGLDPPEGDAKCA